MEKPPKLHYANMPVFFKMPNVDVVNIKCFTVQSSMKSDEHRGSYMSAHVLLNLLNKLGKRDKMRGLPSILSLFRNEFNKFNNREHEC